MTEQRETVGDALASELGQVAAALDLPPETAAALGDALRHLAGDAALAVPSLVGLSLVLDLSDGPVLTALRAGASPDDVAASLQVPVATGAADVGGGCTIILYATRPGAFADLADAFGESGGQDADRLLVDRHLEPPATDLSALRHVAVREMAEGVLIGRGFTEVGAATFLEGLTAASADATAAARQVLRSVR